MLNTLSWLEVVAARLDGMVHILENSGLRPRILGHILSS